jgi:hypothetical protein
MWRIAADFVATCRKRSFCRGRPAGNAQRPWRQRLGSRPRPRRMPVSASAPFRQQKRPGRAAQASRHLAQKQNGSWCCHQPPLVPGPNAAPVRAWRLSWAGRVPAEVLRPRSVPNRNPEGIRSGSPTRRTSPVSLSRSVSPKAPVSLDLRRNWDRPKPHTSPSKTHHRFRGLRPEGHRPLPRWSRFGTFFRRRKSAPRRERPQWRAHPIRKSGILGLRPVDNGDIVDKSGQKSR